MDRRKWRRDSRPCPVPGYPDDDYDVCPGYLVSLPQVVEAARAHSWRKESAIASFYDSPLCDLARDGIDLIALNSGLSEGFTQRRVMEDKK